MTQLWTNVKQWIALYGLQVIGAVAILVLGIIAARIFTGIVRRGLKRAKVDATLVSFLSHVIHFVLVVIVVLAALNQVGFQTTSLIALLGAMGLAVGLAVRGHIASLTAGALILFTRPFRAGDFIEVAGASGTVEAITLLSTQLKTIDGKLVYLPNTKVFSDKLTNFSAKPIRRIDMVFDIGYQDDLVKAKQVLQAVITADDRVLNDPAPKFMVLELAENSVKLGARPWVKRQDYWDTLWEMTERVKQAFDQTGISIPYPQRDVHLKTRPAVAK